MNGPIAQIVALTCHANAFLRGQTNPPRFFPETSTCTFSWLGKARESVVAAICVAANEADAA